MTPKTPAAMLKRDVSDPKPPRVSKKRDARSEKEPTAESAASAADAEAAAWEPTSPYSGVPTSMSPSSMSRSSVSPSSTSPTSTSVVTSAPTDAVRHYETLSKLHKQLAEVENVLANERRERDLEADRMGQMLARLAERESRATEAEKRAEAACARVATLESELVTAQIVAAAIDEQLVKTEEALERTSQPPPEKPLPEKEANELVEQMRARLDALTVTLERMKELVADVTPK